MPIFEYECTRCGRRVEEIQKFGDPPPVLDEACTGWRRARLRTEISSPTLASYVHPVGTEISVLEFVGDRVVAEINGPVPQHDGSPNLETIELDIGDIEEFVVEAGGPCSLARMPTTFTQRWNGDYSNDGRGGWVRQGEAMVRMTQGKNSTKYGEGSV